MIKPGVWKQLSRERWFWAVVAFAAWVAVTLIVLIAITGFRELREHGLTPDAWGALKSSLWVLLAVAVAWVLAEVAWRLWRRNRQARFDRAVVAKEGIEDRRREWAMWTAEMRKQGIDRYELPFYLLVGEPASGKSVMLMNSDLRFCGAQSKVSGSAGTKGCDWWFTEEAVILDLAGRLFVQEGGQADAGEWEAFLDLVADFRPHNPINGVILVIPCDSLLKDGADDSRRKCARIQDSLITLTNRLHIKYPVYVVLTKADKIFGFAETVHSIEGNRREEMCGWSASADDYDKPFELSSFKEGFERLVERARWLRSLAMHRARLPDQQGDIDRGYAFPDELAALFPAVEGYVRKIFSDSRLLERIYFRGLYLTSGVQKGAALANACAELYPGPREADARDIQPVGRDSKAYFIKDLIRKRIFLERGLTAPTRKRVLRKRKYARVAFALTATLALLLTLSGVMLFAASSSFPDVLVAVLGDAGKEWNDPQRAHGATLAELASRPYDAAELAQAKGVTAPVTIESIERELADDRTRATSIELARRTMSELLAASKYAHSPQQALVGLRPSMNADPASALDRLLVAYAERVYLPLAWRAAIDAATAGATSVIGNEKYGEALAAGLALAGVDPAKWTPAGHGASAAVPSSLEVESIDERDVVPKLLADDRNICNELGAGDSGWRPQGRVAATDEHRAALRALAVTLLRGYREPRAINTQSFGDAIGDLAALAALLDDIGEHAAALAASYDARRREFRSLQGRDEQTKLPDHATWFSSMDAHAGTRARLDASLKAFDKQSNSSRFDPRAESAQLAVAHARSRYALLLALAGEASARAADADATSAVIDWERIEDVLLTVPDVDATQPDARVPTWELDAKGALRMRVHGAAVGGASGDRAGDAAVCELARLDRRPSALDASADLGGARTSERRISVDDADAIDAVVAYVAKRVEALDAGGYESEAAVDEWCDVLHAEAASSVFLKRLDLGPWSSGETPQAESWKALADVDVHLVTLSRLAARARSADQRANDPEMERITAPVKPGAAPPFDPRVDRWVDRARTLIEFTKTVDRNARQRASAALHERVAQTEREALLTLEHKLKSVDMSRVGRESIVDWIQRVEGAAAWWELCGMSGQQNGSGCFGTKLDDLRKRFVAEFSDALAECTEQPASGSKLSNLCDTWLTVESLRTPSVEQGVRDALNKKLDALSVLVDERAASTLHPIRPDVRARPRYFDEQIEAFRTVIEQRKRIFDCSASRTMASIISAVSGPEGNQRLADPSRGQLDVATMVRDYASSYCGPWTDPAGVDFAKLGVALAGLTRGGAAMTPERRANLWSLLDIARSGVPGESRRIERRVTNELLTAIGDCAREEFVRMFRTACEKALAGLPAAARAADAHDFTAADMQKLVDFAAKNKAFDQFVRAWMPVEAEESADLTIVRDAVAATGDDKLEECFQTIEFVQDLKERMIDGAQPVAIQVDVYFSAAFDPAEIIRVSANQSAETIPYEGNPAHARVAAGGSLDVHVWLRFDNSKHVFTGASYYELLAKAWSRRGSAPDTWVDVELDPDPRMLSSGGRVDAIARELAELHVRVRLAEKGKIQ